MGFISLDSAVLIGSGSSRSCYRHPDEEGKCIKIEKWPELKITAEELKHYRRLQRRGISWEMLARFHEQVQTDHGPGAVFDMPLDIDGSVSRTLACYLESGCDIKDTAEMAAALLTLKRYLLREHILVRELKPDNMVYQRSGNAGSRFILIDGIGNNQFLPVAGYLRFYGQRVLVRKWSKFEGDLRVRARTNFCAAGIVASLGF